MSSTIIDETVILRYLLDDDEVLSPRAAKVIATRTARVYPEIITRVVVTLRDVYKVPRVEIATAMRRLLDDVMVDEPTVVALAVKLFGKTHMDFTDCLLAARTAIYNDDVVSFGKPIIQGMIDYRHKRQTAVEARSRSTDARGHSTDAAIDKIADAGFDPVYGARPLKRYMQSHLETMLAKAIIAGDVLPGQNVTVDVNADGELEVRK